jgi:hypothetical protein
MHPRLPICHECITTSEPGFRLASLAIHPSHPIMLSYHSVTHVLPSPDQEQDLFLLNVCYQSVTNVLPSRSFPIYQSLPQSLLVPISIPFWGTKCSGVRTVWFPRKPNLSGTKPGGHKPFWGTKFSRGRKVNGGLEQVRTVWFPWKPNLSGVRNFRGVER